MESNRRHRGKWRYSLSHSRTSVPDGSGQIHVRAMVIPG